MTTFGAILGRIGRIHSNKLSTGTLSLVRKELCELTPRHVRNAFSQTVIVLHALDRQILNCNNVKSVDYSPAILMSKVFAPIGDTFVNVSNYFTPFLAFGS